MAKLCTGCGLTTDDSGNLIASVSGTWPYGTTTCSISSAGGPVYCDAVSGKLYVDPPTYYREFTGLLTVNTGSNAPTNAVFGSPVKGGAEPGVPPATASFTFTNPSSCRPMKLYLSAGIQHFLFTVEGGTSAASRGDVQPECDIKITGDVLLGNWVGGHQHWGMEAEAGQIFRSDSQGAYLDFPNVMTCPAGGSFTVTISAQLFLIDQFEAPGGQVSITNWRNSFTIRGWAGA